MMWMGAFLSAGPVSAFVVSLFYYWFGVANRYVIFLYGHFGAGPFDALTVSRYWMTGLVTAGMTAILYAIANWLGGRIAGIRYRRYTPPLWWQVWLLCVPLVGPGALVIMTRLNYPTLPVSLALGCSATALAGLVLAIMPGRMAAERPGELLWLAACGLGLAPSLLLLRACELAWSGRVSPGMAYGLALGGTLVGALWSCGVVVLRAFRSEAEWETRHLIASALIWSYLVGPVVHYLLLTPPGYHYITAASNFFASSPTVQAFCFLTLGLEAWIVTGFQ